MSLNSNAQTEGQTPAQHKTAVNSDRILSVVLQSLDENKAEDVVQIDLKGKSEMGDYMIICSGRSSRQVTGIAEKLQEKLKADLGVLSKIEGKGTGDWLLVDSGDVIVHVFRPEVSDFYQLEKMWLAPLGASEPTKA